MLKLNAGISRKIGEPNYGSRGASVNVELELESGLVNDADALLDRVRKLFSLARQAVDEELANGQPPARPQRPGGQPENRNGGNGNTVRQATDSQVRAIRAIAARLGLDADDAARSAAGVAVDQLSLQQASQVIDDLKARQNTGASR